MLKRISFAVILFAAIFVFNKTSYSQETHFGLYFSTPHIRIVAGEPVFVPYYPHYPVYYQRHHYRHYYGYYYPHRYYYNERPRYRHDRGWHKAGTNINTGAAIKLINF